MASQPNQSLIEDDAYLPWHNRKLSELSRRAVLSASAGCVASLANGVDRQLSDDDLNAWEGSCGEHLEYRFEEAVQVNEVRLVMDSDLTRLKKMPQNVGEVSSDCKVPETLLKKFRLEAEQEDGSWVCLFREEDNYQRLYRRKVGAKAKAFRLIPEETWGADKVRIFGFELR